MTIIPYGLLFDECWNVSNFGTEKWSKTAPSSLFLLCWFFLIVWRHYCISQHVFQTSYVYIISFYFIKVSDGAFFIFSASQTQPHEASRTSSESRCGTDHQPPCKGRLSFGSLTYWFYLDEVQAVVLAVPEAAKWLEGKQVHKVIYVPKKIVNVVEK